MCLGIPGQILDISDGDTPVATVLVSGAKRKVDLSIILDEGPAPGAWVVVHAGLALSMLSEQEALETLALLNELAEAYTGVPH
jgi:hydrogenase expression/formation protein HypC